LLENFVLDLQKSSIFFLIEEENLKEQGKRRSFKEKLRV